jgi:hypothetical protein
VCCGIPSRAPVYSGFRLIGSTVNWGRRFIWGKSWRTKTSREYLGHHAV